jgi:hypothetical protein
LRRIHKILVFFKANNLSAMRGTKKARNTRHFMIAENVGLMLSCNICDHGNQFHSGGMNNLLYLKRFALNLDRQFVTSRGSVLERWVGQNLLDEGEGARGLLWNGSKLSILVFN